MGYEVFQKDGNVFVKQGGRIQKETPLTEIEALYKKGYQDKVRKSTAESLPEEIPGRMRQQGRTAEGNEEEFRSGCGLLRQERQTLRLHAD